MLPIGRKSRRTTTTLWADRSGVSLVQFALMAPILMLLLGGVVEFGRAAFDDMALETAARSALQYAMANPSDAAGIESAALQAGGLPASATVHTATFCECQDTNERLACNASCGGGAAPVTFLSVTVSKPFTSIMPVPGTDRMVTLSGSAVMRVN